MRQALTRIALALLPFLLVLDSSGQDTPLPDRIEEDWQLVIASPDPDLSGPQITMTMKPQGTSSPIMFFNLNYSDQPSFSAGGLQLQVWSGTNLQATSSQGSTLLQTANETISWTQRMSLSGGNLNYKITSGNSTTWGSFGQNDDQLTASASTSLASLSGYDPAASVSDSKAGFEANRVTSLTLVQVRYYKGNTLLSTDGTSRPVSLAK